MTGYILISRASDLIGSPRVSGIRVSSMAPASLTHILPFLGVTIKHSSEVVRPGKPTAGAFLLILLTVSVTIEVVRLGKPTAEAFLLMLLTVSVTILREVYGYGKFR